MKRFISVLVLAVMLISLMPAGVLGATDEAAEGIHVALGGNDRNPGTLEKPVKTIAAAAQLVKKHQELYGKERDIVVYIHGGTYRISNPITFDKTNSGVNGHSVVYKAYGDGEVIFAGTQEIDVNAFEVVTDAQTLARLPKSARGSVASLSLAEQGITIPETETQALPYLFLNGIEQQVASWPNYGYAYTASKAGSKKLAYSESRVANWSTAKDAIVQGMYVVTYSLSTSNIESINTDEKIINLVSDQTPEAGRPWKVVNLLEELDIPGEFYIENGDTLYYYPPYAIGGAKMELVTNLNKPFWTLNGTSNITIEGITFTKGGAGALAAWDGENVHILDCEFSHFQCYNNSTYVTTKYTGYIQAAVCLWTDIPNANSSIEGCVFYRNGVTNINFSGGNRRKFEEGGISILNNRIAESSYLAANSPAAIKGGSPGSSTGDYGFGNLVAHNVISDTSNNNGIDVNFTEGKILYNELYYIGREQSDLGAIYVGRSDTKYHMEFAYNYVHHMDEDTGAGNMRGAVYLDDMWGGSHVHHNISYKSYSGIFAMAGHNNLIENNVAVDCITGLTAGSRGVSDPTNSNYKVGGLLWTELSNYASPEFYERYPETKGLLENPEYYAPLNTRYINNLTFGTNTNPIRGAIAEVEQYGENTNNVIVPYSDEYFVDAANFDFRPVKDSKADELTPGISDFGDEEIGLTLPRDSRVYETPADSFNIRYPRNGQTGVNVTETVFSWDPVRFASAYHLEVSTDKDFVNLVIDERILAQGEKTNYTTDILDENTVYYWRVEAEGLARQTPFTLKSKGGSYVFATQSKRDVDTLGLGLAVNSLEEFYNKINDTGSYKQEYLGELALVLAEGKSVLAAKESQTAVDAMEEKIYGLVKRAAVNVELKYYNLGDLLKNPANWSAKKTSDFAIDGSVNDGILTATAGANRGAFSSDVKIPENSIICMDVKFSNLTNEWGGFAFWGAVNTSILPTGYMLIFKDTAIEFQYRPGDVVLSFPNEYINNDEWVHFEVGAVDIGTGVILHLSVNGNLLLHRLETSSSMYKGDGYFSVTTIPDCITSIRGSESTPEPRFMDETYLSQLNNPSSVHHLAALLDMGAYNMELSSSVYAQADKTFIAKNVIDKIKSQSEPIGLKDYDRLYDLVMPWAVVDAYNNGRSNLLYKLNGTLLNTEILDFGIFDRTTGATLYEYYMSAPPLVQKNVNSALLERNAKSIDKLRSLFAKEVILQAAKAYQKAYAATSEYLVELLTPQNAAAAGIDLSGYFALSDEFKSSAAEEAGRNEGGITTIEELAEILNKRR